MSDAALQDAALRTAVAWKVSQESAPLDAAQQAAFERWLAETPQNRQAWSRVAGALQEPIAALQGLRAQGGQAGASHAMAARQALLSTARRRSVLRGALAVAGVGGAVAWLADRQAPLAQIAADLRTGTGERRSLALTQGASVLLDARSAIDRDGSRLLLRAGALIATNTAAGAGPLTVVAPQLQAVLEQASLMCRLHPGATEVVALEGSALLTAADGLTRRLAPGEGVLAMAAGPWQPLPGRPADRAAWRDGMLAADDWTLADVVDAVRPYFAGHIRLDPAAAGLRVFGIFRLQIDEVLAALAQALPVAVRRFGPWLVSIEKDS